MTDPTTTDPTTADPTTAGATVAERLPIPAAPSPDPALDDRIGVPLVHRFLARPWGRQHVVEAGPVDGTPVMLLHGWPQHWYAYRHVIPALAERGYRVVAVDTRAFGWSTPFEEPTRADMTSTAIAHDAVATLDDLGISQTHVIGHDWGGWFAFATALVAPDRVLSTTAMAIMPPWLDLGQVAKHAGGLAYLPVMGAIGQFVAMSGRAVETLLGVSTGVETTWQEEDGRIALASYIDRVDLPHTRVATRRIYARMVRTELLQACSRVRPPSLQAPAAVWLGEHENISHEDMFRGRNRPEGEVEIGRRIAGAGHWLLDERPEEMARRIIDRLEDLPG